MNSFADQVAARRAQILKHVAAVASSPPSRDDRVAASGPWMSSTSSSSSVTMNGTTTSNSTSNSTNEMSATSSSAVGTTHDRPDWLDSFAGPATPASAATLTAESASKTQVDLSSVPVDQTEDEAEVVDVTDSTPAIMVESSEVEQVESTPVARDAEIGVEESETTTTDKHVVEPDGYSVPVSGSASKEEDGSETAIVDSTTEPEIVDSEEVPAEECPDGTVPEDVSGVSPGVYEPGISSTTDDPAEVSVPALDTMASIPVLNGDMNCDVIRSESSTNAGTFMLPDKSALSDPETSPQSTPMGLDDPWGVISLEKTTTPENSGALATEEAANLDLLGMVDLAEPSKVVSETTVSESQSRETSPVELAQKNPVSGGVTKDVVAVDSPEKINGEPFVFDPGQTEESGLQSMPPLEVSGCVDEATISHAHEHDPYVALTPPLSKEEESIEATKPDLPDDLVPATDEDGSKPEPSSALAPPFPEDASSIEGRDLAPSEGLSPPFSPGGSKSRAPSSEADVTGSSCDEAGVSTNETLLNRADKSESFNAPLAPSMNGATIVQVPPTPEGTDVSVDHEKDAPMVELQSSLQEQTNQRAEAENRARRAEDLIQKMEQELEGKAHVERQLQLAYTSLSNLTSEKSSLEAELEKLRHARDEHERKEILLSNRLNAAKKKEAAKVNAAEQLEDEVAALSTELINTKQKLSEAQASKGKADEESLSTKQQLENRLKQAESSLSDERRLNEERKKKMKGFIETKQEELRQTKTHSEELNQELEQTNRLLREHNARWKQLHAQWVQSQTRNRELQRDLNRIKKDSDNLHKIGDKMEMKMAQSAQETAEHKNKRLTAKHELMTLLRSLEAEREVSAKLRDSIKFTFTPKALSQQQLLRESLQDFEAELTKLSRRLGRPLPPSSDSSDMFTDDLGSETIDRDAVVASNSDGSDTDDKKRNRSEADAAQLLTGLEDETQRISKCIMTLTSSIERMRALLDESGDRTCVTVLTDLLGASGVRRRHENRTHAETTAIGGASSSPRLALGGRRYGQLPTTAT